MHTAALIGGAVIVGFAIGWLLGYLTEGEEVHWTD